MLTVKSFAACVFVVLLLGCTSFKGPAINMDNEGMQPAVGQSNVYVQAGQVPSYPGAESDVLFNSKVGKFKARVYIDTDKKVKNLVFLEGHENNFRVWRKQIPRLVFIFSPDSLPGPWEVDIVVETRAKDTSALPNTWVAALSFDLRVSNPSNYEAVAYRTAKQR
jgi:hypothetical protein